MTRGSCKGCCCSTQYILSLTSGSLALGQTLHEAETGGWSEVLYLELASTSAQTQFVHHLVLQPNLTAQKLLGDETQTQFQLSLDSLFVVIFEMIVCFSVFHFKLVLHTIMQASSEFCLDLLQGSYLLVQKTNKKVLDSSLISYREIINIMKDYSFCQQSDKHLLYLLTTSVKQSQFSIFEDIQTLEQSVVTDLRMVFTIFSKKKYCKFARFQHPKLK